MLVAGQYEGIISWVKEKLHIGKAKSVKKEIEKVKELPKIKTPEFARLLKRGVSGDDVRNLQKALIILGYLPKGSDDGIFGSQTERAVKRFQANVGIRVDGIVGPQTYKALRNELTKLSAKETGISVKDIKTTRNIISALAVLGLTLSIAGLFIGSKH